jgi:predicted RNase H-like HicB family nuclease
MKFTIEVDIETDGRWIAEILEIPGAMVYGKTKEEAIHKVQALGLRAAAEQLENNESENFVNISFALA